MLSTLSRDISYIKDRLPGSGELATLLRHRDDLSRALDEARRADVWLAPKDVAGHTNKGLSTVTKDCRDFEQVIGAVRNGKRSWLIPLADLRGRDGRPRGEEGRMTVLTTGDETTMAAPKSRRRHGGKARTWTYSHELQPHTVYAHELELGGVI